MNLIACIIGLATGILSGMGVGGGSLLVLYLTLIANVNPYRAGGINLLYYIGCASTALIGHIRNHRIEIRIVLWSILGGIIAVIPCSLLADQLAHNLLKRLFGILVLYIAIREWKQSGTME